MLLGEIAHSRTGDKGNISTISVIAYEEKDYEILVEKLTAKKVHDYFKDMIKGSVDRYEIPSIGGLNFVLHDALAGGVTRSLRIDKHGKSLSAYLLEMDIDV